MKEEKPIVHGLLYSYTGRRCKCDDCRSAMKEYSAKYRSTPEGREKARQASRRGNYLRQRAIQHMKQHHPEVMAQFEAEWAANNG